LAIPDGPAALLRRLGPTKALAFAHVAHGVNLQLLGTDGALGQPMFGEFKNGRGEFFDQEPFKGQAILVRQVWSDITPTSHHFEQAFSDDGGKTWEPNFTATLTQQMPKG